MSVSYDSNGMKPTMYQDYWQLNCKPFGPWSDMRFYYPSETHQGALLKLRYAIENRHSAALFSGPSGSGKTLLISQLQHHLPDTYRPFVHLVFPQMPSRELLAYLADELGAPKTSAATDRLDQSIRRIQSFLSDNAEGDHHAVIAIDESQLLADCGTLETMRLLTNFQFDGMPLMTLLLVGQPALLPVLSRMPALDERFGVKAVLRPFTLEETISYVNHRLSTAGAQRAIYADQALETLHRQADGIPRKIDRLGDLTLLVGYAEQADQVTSQHVDSVAEELVPALADAALCVGLPTPHTA
jgi:type II secretory pathway predicted ATPase ExeA